MMPRSLIPGLKKSWSVPTYPDLSYPTEALQHKFEEATAFDTRLQWLTQKLASKVTHTAPWHPYHSPAPSSDDMNDPYETPVAETTQPPPSPADALDLHRSGTTLTPSSDATDKLDKTPVAEPSGFPPASPIHPNTKEDTLNQSSSSSLHKPQDTSAHLPDD